MSIIEQMYHPDRLLYPLRRVGERGSGQWERISWDEAYDEIVRRVQTLTREYGAESIALISGTGRHHLSQFWRFGNVLGTPNATSSGALICLGPRKNAGEFTAGLFAGVDYYGDVKPQGILVWGANPAISGADGELQWHIKDAARRGTHLIVVDPQPTELARQADVWLRLRPGTDGALALGILNVLISENLYDHEFVENWTFGFEELRERCAEYDLARVSEITWVPQEQIVAAARLLAEVKPFSLEWGTGVEQTANAIQTCRAIYLIPALTGNYDVPGGFVESMEIAPTADPLFDRLSPEMMKKCISGGYPLNDGTMTPKLFAHPYLTLDAIRTGEPYKIRALFSNANNTLLSVPDSLHSYACLKELEFFVYMDFFMTPTAELADIVLPAALWPEIDSVYCMPEFGDQAALCMRKVAQVGECKSDEDFFLELCQRLGLDYGAQSQREILDGILTELGNRRPEYAGEDFDSFAQRGWIEPKRTYYNYKTRGGFHTPSGKFELWSNIMAQGGQDPLPCWNELPESPVSRPDLMEQYPLVLTTGSRLQPYFISNNRQIASLRRLAPYPTVTLHPDAAAQAGIREGEWAWIETERGRITQRAHLEPQLDPRVVNCEMGWWYPEAGAPDYDWQLSNANVLTVGAPPCDPVGGAYQLRGLLCRVYPNPDGKKIEERYEASELAKKA
jgi:anaerobic selenocysteine-containing dehydrogenase